MALVSRYKLDGNANDEWGSNDGTNYGTTFGAGVFGQCANFITNDYIDLGTTTDLTPATISISVWMKFNSFQIGSGIAVGASTGTRGVFMGSCLSSDIRFAVYSSGFKYVNIPQSEITLGEWNHYCLTFDDNTKIMSLYLNGVLYGTVTGVTSIVYQNNTWLGKFSSFYFDGSLDEIRIYNHTLSQNEIDKLYFKGIQTKALLCSYDFEDNTDLGYDDLQRLPATNYGATQGTGVNGGSCAVFDGSSYIDLPNESIIGTADTDSFTFSCFFKIPAAINAYGTIALINRWDIGMGSVKIASIRNMNTSSSGKQLNVLPPSDVWHHGCWVNDNGNLIIYIDGVLQATTTIAGLGVSVPNSISSSNGTLAFKGSIDKLQVFNYALRPYEITNLYNFKRVNPQNTFLEAYYPFETNANDYSGKDNHGTVYGATLVKGLRGNAYSFITNDSISLGNTGTVANITSPFTIEILIKPNDVTANQMIFESENTISEILRIQLFSNTLRFMIRTSGVNHIVDITAPTIDVWTHIVITYDKDLSTDNVKFYYNGVLFDTGSITPQLTEANKITYIGRNAISTNNYLNGLLCVLSVYSKALPLTDVQRLYSGLTPFNA